MGKLFNIDNPIMVFLSRLADLIMLNILAFICCLPVVTAGASLTALHYMTIKMNKDEEGYIFRGFFKSFKENFKQATIIWMMLLVVFAIFYGDYYIITYGGLKISNVVRVLILAVVFFVLFTAIYVFPVLARFDNTVFRTIKNAFIMSILNFPRTIIMIVIYLLPIAGLYLAVELIPVVFLLGLSGPAFLASHFFVKIFKKYEPAEADLDKDDFTFLKPGTEEKEQSN